MTSTVIADRYRLDALIGSGGFAQVFAASDLRADRRVALKLMRPRWCDDPRVVGHFANEESALGRLADGPVARALDAGVIDRRCYLVLELLEGAPFGELLDVALPVAELLRAYLALLDAVDCVHRRGVVHGDLKAGNVLYGADGIRLIDFGLARLVGGGARSVASAIGGTPEFMAPELSLDAPRTVASDIYALGAILYELLTGDPPFTGDGAAAIAAQHATAPVVPPSRRAAVPLRPALDGIVVRALAKRPEDRFADIAELAAALRDVLDPTPIAGVRPAVRPREDRPTVR